LSHVLKEALPMFWLAAILLMEIFICGEPSIAFNLLFVYPIIALGVLAGGVLLLDKLWLRLILSRATH
jgi:hypothetical protein